MPQHSRASRPGRACAALIAALILSPVPAPAQTTAASSSAGKQGKPADSVSAIVIESAPLGDAAGSVVTKLTFRYSIPDDVPPGVVLIIQGSISQGEHAQTFRYPVGPDQHFQLSATQTLAAGANVVEARLLLPLEDATPVMIAKGTATITVGPTGKPFIAGEGASADAILAEGVVPEASGTLRIRPPRRDVAPNLFIVDVDAKPPVKRVEFWVEGRKALTRNAPPYTAELDLGKLPKRIEVRVVGYDAEGKYVDADAWIVNERETPLEVKITRTKTPDGISHLKLSVQNPKNTAIRSVDLFADQLKIHSWTTPPYALDLPDTRLEGVEFLRASVTDETNYEASDLLFLNGERYSEELDVNLVELPVSVTDASGAPIAGLSQAAFQVLEEGKPQKISSFNFANNLPISVGVLVDHSGSMKPRMESAREAAVQFFKDILGARDRAFIAGFSWDAARIAPFARDLESLQKQVAAIPDAEGGTALYDAIVTGLYKFRTVEGRKALIVVSDGEDTTSRVSYDDLLTYVRASHVPLYFIGIGMGLGDYSGESKMKALAAETGGIAYFIKDAKRLTETYRQLQKDLRSQYLVSYYTQSTKKDQKYRTVEVRVDSPGAKVRTVRGFIP